VGDVVAVRTATERVLYQLSFAQIERASVEGGSYLTVRARGSLIGWFNRKENRLSAYNWVPRPGTTVERESADGASTIDVPLDCIKLGSVISTDIPIHLNKGLLREGHMVILGMTRMGKSTLVSRLAEELAVDACVMIFDQTGEYVGKRGLRKYTTGDEDNNGLTVFEPALGEPAAVRALNCLEYLANKAKAEYDQGTPKSRIVIVEEAHQFIPEPAGLSFNDQSRESSLKFGALVMQIRKYGICTILISQRTAVVAKSALSQCENIIAFKSVDETGLSYLEGIVGSEARAILPRLRQGQAVVFGPAFSSDEWVAITTPKPEDRSQPQSAE
jgi:DNA helicase HerA-like ATPase